ncbi:SRPBCC family protein [Nocardia sp. NPDC127579]|uniref:SRPBCC family protein n=1 Tax=Nocardia sp. NPDC127579 TaxID=3345402 RepID=UPI0036394A8B
MPKNLEASIDIDATPDQVWRVVSDLKRIPEFSPQTVRTFPIGKVKVGTFAVNLNRDGKLFWPTTSRVVRIEPNTAFAFKVLDNRMIWSFTLEPTAAGTRLIQRREAPNGTTAISRKAIELGMGGYDRFDGVLVAGMNQTLQAIKRTVEAGR